MFVILFINMITIVIDSVTILSSSRIAESRLPSCVPGVPARSFSSFHTWTPTPGSNPHHQPAVPALSTRGHSQLLMGARRLGRASVAAAEPRDPRPLRAGGGLPTPVQRAWGLRNPTQSPDSSSFLTYIVPAGSRATPNMHKIQ